MVRSDRPTRRPADPPQFGLDTRPLRVVDSTESGAWQREGEPRRYERLTSVEAIAHSTVLTWHAGELEALRQIAASNGASEGYDALREAIIEREEIEAEVALLAREHADVDELTSNLPALRVPDESRVFARLVWLVRRWWTRFGERRRVAYARKLSVASMRGRDQRWT